LLFHPSLLLGRYETGELPLASAEAEVRVGCWGGQEGELWAGSDGAKTKALGVAGEVADIEG
jgi:hypothetical protein